MTYKPNDMTVRTGALLTAALGYPVSIKPVKLSKRQRIEKKISVLEKKQIDRISKGRTRGAGAGGFNRDVDNIRHQITLLKITLDDLSD